MAGTVFKQCEYKGCRSSPRCKHPWWMSFSQHGKRYRMKVDDFAQKPVPSKTEAQEKWLPRFIVDVCEGRDPTEPVVSADRTMSVARFIDEEYIPHHIKASKLSYEHSLKSKMDVLRRRFGNLPLHALEKPGRIQDFRRELVESGRAVATVNLYLAQLRHMINWAVGRELLERSPFHKYPRWGCETG